MRILVQKYGGTSVRDASSRSHVINHIKQGLKENYKLIVVVSAIGRKPDPYATDSLLELIDEHTEQMTRERDLLMSCGEVISSVVLVNELRKHNIEATALTGAQAGIVTDDQFGDANIKKIKPNRLLNQLEQSDVVVVAGFQGQTEQGDVTTLGRGGSDTTAASIGSAVQSERIDIFTDVTGIMTADPRVVKDARRLDEVTYMEICDLAHQGAKVVHPRAVEIAMHADIPLRVRSTYSDDLGTLITSTRHMGEKLIPDRLVTGITYIDSISQITVHEKVDQAQIFNLVAEADISIDFINISPGEVAFTIPTPLIERATSLLEDKGYKYSVRDHCAKVSSVGAGMTGVPGVASKIVQALAKQNIEILQAADSHTTIWVLIDEKNLTKALNALHKAFNLNITDQIAYASKSE